MSMHEGSGRVLQLLWIERTVSSVSSLSAFYKNALGFSIPDATDLPDDAIWNDLLGRPISRSAFLGLGEQRLRLLEFASSGRPYPADSNSADLWFQHFAVVVADMNKAYLALQGHGARLISQNGPRQLPPEAGNIIAFKFRDPDGHPLELIYFPLGIGDPQWKNPAPVGASTLGIDHSALSVSDTKASIAFYCGGLGLSVASRQTNSGTAQKRLDALQEDTVDVIALTCSEARTPHIELLAYHRPKGRKLPESVQPTDIAGDRLILQVDDLTSVLARLDRASIIKQVACSDYTAALIRDPDGHLLVLTDMTTPHQGD